MSKSVYNESISSAVNLPYNVASIGVSTSVLSISGDVLIAVISKDKSEAKEVYLIILAVGYKMRDGAINPVHAC